MSTNSSSNRESSVVEIFKAIGAIVAVPTGLFGLANSIFSQPIIALVVAMITAVLASIVVVRCGWTGITEVITAWLVLTVIVLASFVIWPRTMTVEGTILNEEGNPISNEQVTLFDRSNRRYETKTDAEGYYQFIEVPSGKYRVRVRTSEIEGETKGILVRVVQQNLTLFEITPTPTATPIPPIDTSVPPTDTPMSEPPADSPTPKPTPTDISVPPTDTPTSEPLADTPTPTPSPTLTPEPSSTLPPDAEITACFAGGECFDNFNQLNTKLWCSVASQSTFSGGQLIVTAPRGTEQEVKPCTDYNLPLKFIELKMSVRQSTGTSEKNRAGIQSGLADRYFTFGLNTAGGAYIYNPLVGEDPLLFPVGGNLGQSHTLRIEWTGGKVLLLIDNKTIYEINSTTRGDWFLLTVGAQEKSDITASFENVCWSYVSR